MKKILILFILFLFLAISLPPLVSHATAEPPGFRKFNKFLMDHAIKNPTVTHYSLIGRITPLRGSLQNLKPIMWQPENESRYRMLVYYVCINVNLTKINDENYNVLLDIWMMWYNETYETGHKKLTYHVDKGYIKYGDKYGLFPFYIVGIENKSKIEKMTSIPYFGFWIRDIENIHLDFERNDGSKKIDVNMIRTSTNETFSANTVINNTPYLVIPSSPILELYYRWRIPVEIGGILPANIFPFTDDNCTYYLLGGPVNSIYFDYKTTMDGLNLAPTESNMNFLQGLPPTGYETNEPGYDPITIIIIVAIFTGAAAIVVRMKRRKAA